MLTHHLNYVIMNSRRPDTHADGMRRATTSRRALLTASGAVAIGALSGCLSQVASSVTNTGSSPAAVFAGAGRNDDDTEIAFMIAPGSPHVARLTPTLAGRVELEGWVTSAAVMAQDYNSSRSNKRKTRAADEDSDADGVDDDVRGEDYNSPRSNRSIAGPSDIIDDGTTRRSGASRGLTHNLRRRRLRLPRRFRSGVRGRDGIQRRRTKLLSRWATWK